MVPISEMVNLHVILKLRSMFNGGLNICSF